MNPTHIYSNRGTYDVLLSVYNSFTDCNHQLIRKITITDPIAEFDYLLNANNGYEDSLGCAPHKVYLDNKSQDCAYFQVRWSDGYVAYGEVDHILDSAGYKSVEMIVTDIHGCKDTMYYELSLIHI